MLTDENVMQCFRDCLFKNDEPVIDPVEVEGVRGRVSFHPERLAEQTDLIKQMISELPAEFFPNTGGGHSFLNMCNRADGQQWTGFHQVMDYLVCLGLASKLLIYLMPRDMWKILPGGMPYLAVDKSVEPAAVVLRTSP